MAPPVNGDPLQPGCRAVEWAGGSLARKPWWGQGKRSLSRSIFSRCSSQCQLGPIL